MSSGLATAVLSIVALIAAEATPKSLAYFLIDLVFPKLYYNCMLVSLNVRSSLLTTAGNGAGGGMSINLENIGPTSSRSPNVTASSTTLYKDTTPRAIECRVDLEVEYNTDQRKDLEVGFRMPATEAGSGFSAE
ncbi:hypothetical protein ACEPAI_2425 [Sanghuangporus weigelae]